MKNSFVHNLMKKTVAGTLAVAMVLTGAIFGSANMNKVEAAGEAKVELFNEISTYAGKTRIAPKPTDTTYKNYLFAGWYEDEACTTVCDATSGKAYAKFVSPQVLSAGCQITNDVNKDSTTSDLRMVSTVDGLKYQAVGFDIKMGKWSYTSNSTTVYDKIVTTTTGLDYTANDPTIFDAASTKFFTFKLLNIENKWFGEGISITPYWVTLDGTKVSGITRYARVEDGYSNIINVPVRLYNDEAVAAGYLEVLIPDGCTYVGYDAGIFEEMEVAVSGSTVKIVGNVADISNDKTADGLYANLRFSTSSAPKDGAFKISGLDFCDISENTKTLSVVEAAYNDFQK